MPTTTPAGAPSMATISVEPSGSKRNTVVKSTPDSRDPSTATARSTSSADIPRAESSAIRRSAACSSAKVVNAMRAWLLPTATAMSCANWARRSSVPGGSGCEGEVAVNIPHTASDTVTGADTAAPRPYERASAASRSPA